MPLVTHTFLEFWIIPVNTTEALIQKEKEYYSIMKKQSPGALHDISDWGDKRIIGSVLQVPRISYRVIKKKPGIN